MRPLSRPDLLAWLALVALSALWVAAMDGRRIAQLERISDQAPIAAVDGTSPTGYAHHTRGLLLPVGSERSQAVIMDVQQMAATGAWHIQHAAYDNAPEGRPVHGAAPYRWWLRLIAAAEGEAGGRAIERAALHADPALHVLLVLAAGLLAAWRFGPAAGGLLALGTAALLAQAEVFAPGRPHNHGLFLAVNLLGLLCLLAAWKDRARGIARGWMVAAGLLAGLGLWLDASSQLVVLGAWTFGGLVATRFARGSGDAPLPWRLWVAGGALAGLGGWLAEGRPGGLAGQGLDTNHPWLVVTWLAAAELLVRWQARPWRDTAAAARVGLLATLAVVVAVPVWLAVRGSVHPVVVGPDHPVLAARAGLLAWLRADGVSIGVVAALLPLVVGVPAYLVARRDATQRPVIVFAGAGLAVLFAAGVWQLRWWGVVDIAVLGLLALVAAATPAGLAALAWRTGLGLLLLPAIVAAWPSPSSDNALAPAEARALVERDLAHWLAARSEPGTIVFAPPALAGALAYYGGLRVIASPYPGNEDGLALAARIAATGAVDEAQALLQGRGIQYVVLPSWDESLDRLSRASAEQPERAFIVLLRQWMPPRWLRPVAYQMPVIPGLEQDSLAVFEVVEPQENAMALSRLAEYFVDTGRLQLAAALGDTLEQSFAADAGAMIARAKVALARGETRTLARIMPELLPAVADGRDEDLPWERRANLAIVLAQTKHPDLARPQVEFCLQEADLERLRSLGPVSLYRLLTLARVFHLEFADPALRPVALGLLPAEFQTQLAP